jgi:hypothetical protein
MFQVHLGVKTAYIHGIDTEFLQNPTLVAYDQHTQKVYWYESIEKVVNYIELSNPNRIRALLTIDSSGSSTFLEVNVEFISLLTVAVGAMDVSPSTGRLFIVADRAIYYIQTTSREPKPILFYQSINRIEVGTLMVDDDRE